MEKSADWMLGYAQGVAVAGAQLIGCVAAELGPDHALVERLVMRLGDLRADGPEPQSPVRTAAWDEYAAEGAALELRDPEPGV